MHHQLPGTELDALQAFQLTDSLITIAASQRHRHKDLQKNYENIWCQQTTLKLSEQ